MHSEHLLRDNFSWPRGAENQRRRELTPRSALKREMGIEDALGRTDSSLLL